MISTYKATYIQMYKHDWYVYVYCLFYTHVHGQPQFYLLANPAYADNWLLHYFCILYNCACSPVKHSSAQLWGVGAHEQVNIVMTTGYYIQYVQASSQLVNNYKHIDYNHITMSTGYLLCVQVIQLTLWLDVFLLLSGIAYGGISYKCKDIVIWY